ncbi:MAG: archaeosortase/exosortase family protein [Victivallaceae bacterium]|jgi:exosortase/archaeosortase family protein
MDNACKQPVVYLLASIIYIVAAECLALNFAPGVSALFCQPAAWLTHAVTGWPLSVDDHVFVLETPDIMLRITDKCSGFSFFLTLHAVILLALALKSRKLMIISIPPVLAASYVLAVSLNVCRVMCSYQLKRLLPGDFFIPYAGIHLFIGVMIFIPALILAFILINKTLLRFENSLCTVNSIPNRKHGETK